MLQRLGYRVVATESSRDALALFTAAPEDFDLVITDMTMPQMTGEELARRILAIRTDMPIILCTGYSERISSEQARRIGIRAYLMKPLTIEEMAHTVRKVIDGEATGA
jgi:CheY-like chemotaxis protein